jgi:molybdopterin/thiamine biosynthesis adenylyltransferase
MDQTPYKIDGPLEPRLAENTSIKLIGLGGVGSIIARNLSIFMASLNLSLRLVLIDGDSFEGPNANRMLFSKYGNKAAVIRAELLPRFTDSYLSLIAVEEFVTASNIDRLILNRDIVMLAVDNHATRKLVSDFCRTELEDVGLISGGNDGIEYEAFNRSTRGTYGNCQIYLRRAGEDLSPALTRYHPEIREPADRNPADKNCAELVQSVPQILFANLAAASAMLNAFWLYCCDALHYSELAFDIADGLMRPVPLPVPHL